METGPSPRLPLVSALSRAASAQAIYPPGHPQVEGALSALERAVAASVGPGGGEVQIVVLDGELVLDGRALRTESLQLRAFTRGMSRLGIESLRLLPGLAGSECRRLVEGLAGLSPLEPSAHVAVGRLQLPEGTTPEGSWGEISERALDRAEEAFLRLRTDPEPAVEQLGHLLGAFVEQLARTERSLLLPPPADDPDRALFLHSFSVAHLVLAQAASLGIRGQALQDLGLAAMLHDVGKLHLPTALLRRRGRLEDREWEVARLHPALGAAFLAGLRNAPEVAVLVAYEHHWRWDGEPSYPANPSGRAPGLASRLTAVADTYDAIVAGRNLDGGPGSEQALALWRRRAGTFLDPVLATHFLGLVG